MAASELLFSFFSKILPTLPIAILQNLALICRNLAKLSYLPIVYSGILKYIWLCLYISLKINLLKTKIYLLLMLWNLRQSMKSRTYLILLVLLNGKKDSVMWFKLLFVVQVFHRSTFYLILSLDAISAKGFRIKSFPHPIQYTVYSQHQFRQAIYLIFDFLTGLYLNFLYNQRE